MGDLLREGQQLFLPPAVEPCTVGRFLGGGTQGEVYHALLGNQDWALKWYRPGFDGPEQRESLRLLVAKGSPCDRFLWPEMVVEQEGIPGFGYLMPLREARFQRFNRLLCHHGDHPVRLLATVGFELANSFWQLHCKGLCYCDISGSNLFFDPQTGEIRICDNDNVGVDGHTRPGVAGTLEFMAPEVVRGEAPPSIVTDLHSLAVLLFHLFLLHHPLEGMRENAIHCLDLAAKEYLYGEAPLFIFDPDDHANAPHPVRHATVLANWPFYPRFLQDLFVRSFTEGLRDPANGRVRETEWRAAMVRLRDTAFGCPCGAENFLEGGAAPEGSLAQRAAGGEHRHPGGQGNPSDIGSPGSQASGEAAGSHRHPERQGNPSDMVSTGSQTSTAGGGSDRQPAPPGDSPHTLSGNEESLLSGVCWACRSPLPPPPCLCVDRQVVVLTAGVEVFPHHLDPDRRFDFSAPCGKVVPNPNNPQILGLQNLTDTTWTCHFAADGSHAEVPPGRSVKVGPGTTIDFGTAQGEITG